MLNRSQADFSFDLTLIGYTQILLDMRTQFCNCCILKQVFDFHFVSLLI